MTDFPADVQVIGASGMLGRAVRQAARSAGLAVAIRPTRIQDMTAADIDAPLVINCAGIVKQRLDVPASQFFLVNGYGPLRLAELCERLGLRFVQISTDCVFSGKRSSYCEDFPPDAVDVYGLSKRVGEVAAPHLTIRTSFVGWGARGLLAELVKSDKEGGEVNASRQVFWNGHTADAVAVEILRLARCRKVAGVIHIPGEEVSRVQLVYMLTGALNLKVRVNETDQPHWSRVLATTRTEGARLPSLAAQIKALRDSPLRIR